MRAFLGLPLHEDATAELVRLQDALGQGRPVAPENLHVTLVFLDDQPGAALEALHDALAEIALPAFELWFSGVEAKGGRIPSLVWAAVVEEPALRQLHARARAAAHLVGIDLPRTRFRPHVTLARFGRSVPVNSARLGAWLALNGTFRAGPFAADRFCLYRSTLTPVGPIYEVLAEYGLG